MYSSDAFKIDDTNTIQCFIAANGLATLVTATGGRPIATHLPAYF